MLQLIVEIPGFMDGCIMLISIQRAFFAKTRDCPVDPTVMCCAVARRVIAQFRQWCHYAVQVRSALSHCSYNRYIDYFRASEERNCYFA